MLAKVNRITSDAEFRVVFRKGRRFSTEHFVVVAASGKSDVSRFGFVVSKKVAKTATKRNVVRRRMQTVAADFVHTAGSKDVVIRALPGSELLAWDELRAELRILDRVFR